MITDSFKYMMAQLFSLKYEAISSQELNTLSYLFSLSLTEQ